MKDFMEVNRYPLLIAGPCTVESREQVDKISYFLKGKGINFLRGGVFKPRTDPDAFQGLGMDGLRFLREAADRNSQKTVVEALTTDQLDQAYGDIDVLQIGSRNMKSYGLLQAFGKRTSEDRKPVLLKRGMDATLDEFVKAGRHILKYRDDPENILYCFRGIRTFEQMDSMMRNTPDLASILELRDILGPGPKILFDPSHSTGDSRFVSKVSQAALLLGADGLMVEVHDSPENALVDGKQSLDFTQFSSLLDGLEGLKAVRIVRGQDNI